jgi:hypothetical protein
MGFTFEQQIFVVEHYFASKFVSCKQALQDALPNETVPNKTMVNHLIRKFHKTGSVLNHKCNCRYAVLSNSTLEDMRLSFLQLPSKSLRKLAQMKNMFLGSAHKGTKWLKLQVYHVHVMHELRPTDHAAKFCYCHWFKYFVHNNIQVLDSTFFLDEAWFHLSSSARTISYGVLITCILTVKLHCTW